LTGDTLNDSAPTSCGLVNTGSVVVNTTTKKIRDRFTKNPVNYC